MADVRKSVHIHMGSDVANPKLGLQIKMTANSKATQEALSKVSGYSPENPYFFITIKSTNPEQLKAAFEEFLTTAIGVAKEMSPEVDSMVGDSAFEVVVNGDLVVAAVDLNKNPFTSGWAQKVEKASTTTIKNEANFNLALLLDKSLNEVLNVQQAEMDNIHGEFTVELTSSKSDKYAVKQQLLQVFGEKAHLNGPSDKFARLMFLMFDSASLTLSSDSKVSFSQATGAYLTKAKEKAEKYINLAKEMYTGNKDMIDSFPFVQAFFDAIQEHGNGQVKIGVFHKVVSGEVNLFGQDLGQIYKRIVG